MIYPKNIEVKLGFDKIRQLLKEHCISSLGQAFVDKIQFSNNFELISKLTLQTAEFCDILQQGDGFPKQNYIDVSQYLVKAALEGAFLTDSEFFDLKLSLRTIADCLKFFDKTPEEDYPSLKAMRNQVEFEAELIDRIELVIDDRGKIRDDASYELRSIRARIIEEQGFLRKKLDQILRGAKRDGFVKEDAQLTLREGRMVIPVAAEYKRKIKGYIHDESATGQTVFLEPAVTIDINNEIRELHYQERREIIRILTKLTDEVRPHVQHLEKAYHFLGMMDFVRSKALFAQQIDGVRPNFYKKNLVDWRQAKHPLLFLSLKEQGKSIIPLTMHLHSKQRILIISGPNAGGKSVALKTVGLLQYMFQSGLLVPMDEDSSIGLFKNIFIDIGDEQSIENDLSTYSSHLTSMKHFLQFAHKHTLFLIDEFGTGTEPSMGGAISEAILEKLNASRTYGVITTHYTNLKTFAENQEGVVNGAMQFDAKNLEPLYQLEVGLPGSSFAFEIAKKIGLPTPIINKARNHAGLEQVNYDQLLRELEIEKKNFTTQSEVVVAKEKKLKEVTEEYAKLRDFLDKEKARIINKAKEEAKIILNQANRKIENTIRVIKENQAEKEITKKIREELEVFKEEIKPKEIILEEPVEEEVKEEIKVIEGEINVGDHVRLKGQMALGEVIAIKGKDVEILIGDLKSNVKKNRLEKVSVKALKEERKKVKRAFKGIDMNEKMKNFSAELDLRGKRGEEAVYELEVFLDDAILLGIHEIRIIHGKGDGILRKLIREKLNHYKEVTAIRDEHADRGGTGISIATLK